MMRPVEDILADRLRDAEMRLAKARGSTRFRNALSYETGRVEELRVVLKLIEKSRAASAD